MLLGMEFGKNSTKFSNPGMLADDAEGPTSLSRFQHIRRSTCHYFLVFSTI